MVNLMLLPLGMLVLRLAAPILRIQEAYMLVMICLPLIRFLKNRKRDLK